MRFFTIIAFTSTRLTANVTAANSAAVTDEDNGDDDYYMYTKSIIICICRNLKINQNISDMIYMQDLYDNYMIVAFGLGDNGRSMYNVTL